MHENVGPSDVNFTLNLLLHADQYFCEFYGHYLYVFCVIYSDKFNNLLLLKCANPSWCVIAQPLVR